MKWIIQCGDEIYGPFDHADEAVKWVDQQKSWSYSVWALRPCREPTLPLPQASESIVNNFIS